MIMSILSICWGNPNYLGIEMFIKRRIGRREIVFNVYQYVIRVYNTMHVG
jgi:hypothetical protein